MPTNSVTGWPYDSDVDVPNGAAQMLRLVLAAAGGAAGSAVPVLRFADVASRNAAQADVPAGALATTTAPAGVYMRTATGWLDVYTDTGWVTEGFTPASGWDLTGGYATARKVGPLSDVRVQVSRSGADITANSTGNIGESNVLTVPPQFAPSGTYALCTARGGSGTSGSAILYTTGTIVLSDLHAGSTISQDSLVTFQFTFLDGKPA